MYLRKVQASLFVLGSAVVVGYVLRSLCVLVDWDGTLRDLGFGGWDFVGSGLST